VTDSSNVTPDPVHHGRTKDRVPQLVQDTIINSVKNIDPIAYHYYFNLFLGKTKVGTVCYIPDSHRKGCQDFLDGRKLSIELGLYALGQSANGESKFTDEYKKET
jgi:hypothetical protein